MASSSHLRDASRRVSEDEPDQFRSVSRYDPRTWPLGPCFHCGQQFQRRHSEHRYCSNKCSKAAFKTRGGKAAAAVVSCERCGAQFVRTNLKRRFCSTSCQHTARAARWQRRHREQFREHWRDWYRRNAEKVKTYVRDWKRKNPDREALYERRRRASRLRVGGRHSMDDVLLLLEAYEWRCAYCGEGGRLTIDHLVPLSRGGSDGIENLIPACLSCNSSKHDRTELEFRAEKALQDFIRGRASRKGPLSRGGGMTE